MPPLDALLPDKYSLESQEFYLHWLIDEMRWVSLTSFHRGRGWLRFQEAPVEGHTANKRWICDLNPGSKAVESGKDLGLEAAQLPLYEADQGFSKCSPRTSCELVNLRSLRP